jgi:HAD superfamily hydrolase (TIGR01509 family)
MDYKCIIFDCDGVLVDSETISAKIFQEMAAELGFQMDFETAVEHFAGVSMQENLKLVAENIDGDLPENFEKQYRKRTYEAFKKDLQPIDGIHSLIKKINVPFCVASSGPIEKIRLNLTTANLIGQFEGKIFSSYDIGSWKPEPQIYLHAAQSMGFSPEECIVIEDSVSGILAAIEGGFKVFALGNSKKKDKFEKLGATVFLSMSELEGILNLSDN